MEKIENKNRTNRNGEKRKNGLKRKDKEKK